MGCLQVGYQRWFSLEPMMLERAGLATAIASRCIVAAGGTDRSDSNSLLEIYSLDQQIWTQTDTRAPLQSVSAAATLDGRIYIIGGESIDQIYCSQFLAFDPVQETWMEMPSLR